jgi:SAM-dependent methyltransferase
VAQLATYDPEVESRGARPSHVGEWSCPGRLPARTAVGNAVDQPEHDLAVVQRLIATHVLLPVLYGSNLPSMRSIEAESERVRAIYDRRGPALTPRDGGFLFGDARSWLASQARGDTLEVGIGTGLTLAHYPPDVRLTGIDLSPVMLAAARVQAKVLGHAVTLRLANAMALDAADASFDTVVFCLVLCTVPDDRRAIREAARVLRPGGHLLAVEHVRSPHTLVRLVERLWEPIAVRQDGDHVLRDPVDHLASAGFVVETLVRSRLGIVERLVAIRLATS